MMTIGSGNSMPLTGRTRAGRPGCSLSLAATGDLRLRAAIPAEPLRRTSPNRFAGRRSRAPGFDRDASLAPPRPKVGDSAGARCDAASQRGGSSRSAQLHETKRDENLAVCSPDRCLGRSDSVDMPFGRVDESCIHLRPTIAPPTPPLSRDLQSNLTTRVTKLSVNVLPRSRDLPVKVLARSRDLPVKVVPRRSDLTVGDQ